MDRLTEVVESLAGLAAGYKPGIIVEAERIVDIYLAVHPDYRTRKTAMDALQCELAQPSWQAYNRGGLFELVEMHLRRRRREMVVRFQ